MIIVLILAILAPILARILYFACSRRREYLADASAAVYTRYPEGLASALEKITGHYKGTGRRSMRQRKANRVLAPMYIINPMEAVAAVGLFSTHPPSKKRISLLRSMAGGVSYQEYNEAFRKVNGGKGVIGKRTLAGDSPVARREASAEKKDKKAAQDRSHDVVQMLGRLENLLMLTCVCGVGIKVPPTLRRDSIACPRCGQLNMLPLADVASGKPDEFRYRRRGKGWESVKCPCGGVTQISPALSVGSIACAKCRKKIEIES